MRQLIKEFVDIVSRTLPIIEPIYEFGSLQVSGQEGFADLRPYFKKKKYIGCDMIPGPGVDRILDCHNIALSEETAGTVLAMDTLEHVEFVRQAISEFSRILKLGGIVVISSHMNFPIHNYPNDYWRFTPEGFKSILRGFALSFGDSVGDQKFPHTVVGIGCSTTISNDILQRFVDEERMWKQRWDATWP